MKNKIKLTERQLHQIIKESVMSLLEYNDAFLQQVDKCGFLSDEDKRQLQIVSMNNWDRHEREERAKHKEDEIKKMMKLSNPNINSRSGLRRI